MTSALGPMLLYVDVTNACSIGCTFCMYLPVQGARHLDLDDASIAGLGGLVKAAPVVHISGQGEPLFQADRVLAVAALAGPEQEVEIITSGGVPWPRLEAFLDAFEGLARNRGFAPRLRLSADRWHASAVRHRNHAAVIRRSVTAEHDTTRISFRSVTSERQWLPTFFAAELADLPHRWSDLGPLAASLTVEGKEFGVAMKRLVRPAQVGIEDAHSLEEYLDEVSRSKGRPFTIGNLACRTPLPGADVTVRPDGVVQLYGLDGVRGWDLRDPALSPEAIATAIETEPLLRTFYETPLICILRDLRRDPRLAQIIDEAANPYWIVPALRSALGDDLENAILGFGQRAAK
jgi:hypothetical protein